MVWARMVVSDDTAIFTMLLPIRIALSIFEELSRIFKIITALLFSSSARERMRILLTVVRAVSADEKNAESNSKIIIAKIIKLVPGSNWKITPFYIIFIY